MSRIRVNPNHNNSDWWQALQRTKNSATPTEWTVDRDSNSARQPLSRDVNRGRVKPRSKDPPRPGTKNKLIMALIAVSWICGGALLKLNAPWLYLLIAISVTAALWVGRRQGWLLRTVVLLALAIPISKIVQKRSPKEDLHENTPTTFTVPATIYWNSSTRSSTFPRSRPGPWK